MSLRASQLIALIRLDLEHQVVYMHLLLILHDLYNEAVHMVPFPLQSECCIFIHIQVGLFWQEIAIPLLI